MKKISSFLMIVLLLLSMITPAFASATPSNASLEDYLQNYEKIPLPADNPGLGVTASDEEWMGDDGNLVASDSDWTFETPTLGDPIFAPPSLLSSGEEVSNTVIFSNCWVQMFYYNTAGILINYLKKLDSNGDFLISKPTDFGKIHSIEFVLYRSSLPPSGKYNMSFHFGSHTGGFTYKNCRIYSAKDVSNAVGYQGSIPVSNFSQFSGSFTGSLDIEIGTPYQLNIVVDVDGMIPPYGGGLSVRFEPLSSSAPVNGSTAGGGTTEQDMQQSIAQNTASMSDTLKEIVQTISKQLEALWNQMYNYIHLEDMANADKNADKIVNALGNEISVQIENDNQISEEIMANDNKNTDTIVNGYDGSGIDADTNRLNSSINEYEEAESQVLHKVNDELGNFEFSDSLNSYVSAVSLISGFIQDIYDNSGGFKDVINIGFFLSIASIVIGMYRFKEG